ncbi:MAG: lytic transglycosylase domain-containing protein [Alphaproteobacteria bacterium]|nr:lytic transglycosylase domain-containing protein [Alphaproteobacteria bacterium]
MVIGAVAALSIGSAVAAEPARPVGAAGAQLETVIFADPALPSVRVVRGAGPAAAAKSLEIVDFGASGGGAVKVLRGASFPAAARQSRPAASFGVGAAVQRVTFADPQQQPVTVVRGAARHSAGFELFGPASDSDLNRVAFAVDGVESSHGADWRMWRPEPSGPQGPMQVSEAAASDVGGGNRFDESENRALGRAYLARLYRRYGNWGDAVAAYNWGPGNMDGWIAAGRIAARLPLEVEHYVERVVAGALVAEAGLRAAM